ncbi:hypothetical protein NY78_3159 [Desulfovibrio sp. TomC]|nr:hypothetical protein NY78_3159 [Desulfovibrio sp. TomC]
MPEQGEHPPAAPGMGQGGQTHGGLRHPDRIDPQDQCFHKAAQEGVAPGRQPPGQGVGQPRTAGHQRRLGGRGFKQSRGVGIFRSAGAHPVGIARGQKMVRPARHMAQGGNAGIDQKAGPGQFGHGPAKQIPAAHAKRHGRLAGKVPHRRLQAVKLGPEESSRHDGRAHRFGPGQVGKGRRVPGMQMRPEFPAVAGEKPGQDVAAWPVGQHRIIAQIGQRQPEGVGKKFQTF